MRRTTLGAATGLVLGLTACGGDNDALTGGEQAAIRSVKTYVTTELSALERAATDLCAAAPVPRATGWSMSEDAAAITAMKSAWKRARVSYERVEGAIAVLFPNLDAATDERYDGFLEEGPDTNLFDGEGVTGVHAIERILWANEIPAHVVTFEAALTGYSPAAWPANMAEATAFRDGLCARLVTDVGTMKRDFAPLALDAAAAFRGVIGSMEEQLEKTALAATGEDESRYAQHTLADMRANLEGGEATLDAFRPWLRESSEGMMLEATVDAAYGRVRAAYSGLSGEALPTVPATWNPDMPSAADLATPYGQLWQVLRDEADPARTGSLVHALLEAGDAMGIPEIPE